MSPEFEKVIQKSFGSTDAFKEKFINSALTVFGS
jgi:superoxide dismutase